MKIIEYLVGVELLFLLTIPRIVNAQLSAFEIKNCSTAIFKVNTDGNLTFKGPMKYGNAAIYITANTMATMASQKVWYLIDSNNWAEGSISGWSLANSRLTAGSSVAGTYLVLYSMRFYGGNTDNYDIVIRKNNVAQDNTYIQRMIGTGGQGDVGNSGGCGLVTFAQGDYIDIWIKPTGQCKSDYCKSLYHT